MRDLASWLQLPDRPDWSDEHERWSVYRVALRSEGSRERLMRAIAAESDLMLAGAVVNEITRNGEPDADIWVALLPAGSRERETANSILSDETIMREVVLSGHDFGPEEIATWSTALQRAAARATLSGPGLDALANGGRTARIRRLAGDRSRQLRANLKRGARPVVEPPQHKAPD